MLDVAALALSANHALTASNVALLLGAAWKLAGWKRDMERDIDEAKRRFAHHTKTDCDLRGGLAGLTQQLNELTLSMKDQLGEINTTLARIDERQKHLGGTTDA